MTTRRAKKEAGQKEASTEGSGQRGHLFAASFAGIVAASLGLVYAAGAVSKLGEVMGAGYEPGQIFAALPPEQFLSYGLAAVLDPWNLLIVFSLVTNVVSNLSIREGMLKAGNYELDRRVQKSVRAATVVLLAVLLLAASPRAAAQIVIAVALTFVVYTTFFWPPYVLPPTLRNVVFTLAVCFFLTLNVAGAFITPAPPPEVTVAARSGPVRGLLFGETTTAWYVGQPKGKLLAVPADEVQSVAVEKPRDADDPSLASLLLRAVGLGG